MSGVSVGLRYSVAIQGDTGRCVVWCWLVRYAIVARPIFRWADFPCGARVRGAMGCVLHVVYVNYG